MTVEYKYYRLTPARLRSLKAAVTRAQNKKDWQGVIRACNHAITVFQMEGYPDCWSDFQRHKDDAECSLTLNRMLIDRGCW